jgi:hypothetical protein
VDHVLNGIVELGRLRLLNFVDCSFFYFSIFMAVFDGIEGIIV